MIKLSHNDVQNLVVTLAQVLADYAETLKQRYKGDRLKVFPIPRGGIPVVYLLKSVVDIEIVSSPSEADCFVDDLIDSGKTAERYFKQYQGAPFFTLIDKRIQDRFYKKWIVFPWELGEERKDDSGTDIVVRLLQLVGEDPEREGLLETPQRVIKAWRLWCGGYGKDPKEIMKVFGDGGENYDQMVTVKDIPFYSHCEHHLAPFFGTATVSYIPNGKIVGLSKISRLVDIFARRLQVQERLTAQIADALFNGLQAKGVGVVIQARHLCMESRGIQQQGHHTITTALRGAMLTEASTRSEFMSIAH